VARPEYGITPYSAFPGALKLADPVAAERDPSRTD
jgi:hypothetical protein